MKADIYLLFDGDNVALNHRVLDFFNCNLRVQ